MNVFGATYAAAYDQLYGDKDYASECDMIEALLRLSGTGLEKARLLDLGCGTGNHAIPLALRGYEVAGVDLSNDMLVQAQHKAAAAGVSRRAVFHHGDVRTVDLARKDFDGALMMFAVLGYQQTDDDVRAALRTARVHILPGAPFIFDIWYGPGVIADRPGARKRVIEKGANKVIRHTDAILDEARHLCTVRFDLETICNGISIGNAYEEHVMRFFFPAELERFAAECGFSLVTLRSFPRWQDLATPSSWNAVGMLRAV